MKKTQIFIILIFFLTCAKTIADEKFVDYVKTLNLNENQNYAIQRIKNEEEQELRPYVLDISAKENGVELLKNMQCAHFDFNCKRKLKEDIKQRELERNDLFKRIENKKLYYESKYKNALTREQILEVEKTRNYTEHKEKVLKEKAKRAKKQARIKKMKFWTKFQNQNNIKQKPPKKLKGDMTGF